jgi:hypothetical protein
MVLINDCEDAAEEFAGYGELCYVAGAEAEWCVEVGS